MEFNPLELSNGQLYNFMMSAILPRPIAWISTVDREGRDNIAPFSYFMGVCCNPMTVLFCPVVGDAPRIKKDTLLNIEQVPEFVVNVATENVIEKVNFTAAPLDRGLSEFDFANISKVPSQVVKPPRVRDARIAFECAAKDIIEISSEPGGGWIVIGTVLRFHVHDAAIDLASFQVDPSVLQPIGRAGGASFVRTTDSFSLKRISSLSDLKLASASDKL